MGFKVSDLVIGMGALMIVVGATHVIFLAPALYWVAGPALESPKKAAAVTPGRLAPLGT